MRLIVLDRLQATGFRGSGAVEGTVTDFQFDNVFPLRLQFFGDSQHSKGGFHRQRSRKFTQLNNHGTSPIDDSSRFAWFSSFRIPRSSAVCGCEVRAAMGLMKAIYDADEDGRSSSPSFTARISEDIENGRAREFEPFPNNRLVSLPAVS